MYERQYTQLTSSAPPTHPPGRREFLTGLAALVGGSLVRVSNARADPEIPYLNNKEFNLLSKGYVVEGAEYRIQQGMNDGRADKDIEFIILKSPIPKLTAGMSVIKAKIVPYKGRMNLEGNAYIVGKSSSVNDEWMPLKYSTIEVGKDGKVKIYISAGTQNVEFHEK